MLLGGDTKKRDSIQKQMSRDRRHVATAEEHPVFQGKHWRQSQVLAAKEGLELMPAKRDQALAIDIISERGVPPKTAIAIIENLALKSAIERKGIDKLYRSDDRDKQTLAKTRAAALPPMPDRRLPMTRQMLELVRSCKKLKQDDLTAAYAFVEDQIKAILAELDEAYKKLKEEG